MIHEYINPDGVSQADLAVFIPSCREADSITLPVRKAAIGLRKFFPDFSAVIVNCDNNSQDGTLEAFFAAESNVPRIYAASPPGLTGKGLNLKNAFEIAARLGVKVAAIVDANLLSIKSSWIKTLIQPVLDGAEYTAPIYLRHKNDAPISRALGYPLFRALFGRRVLQPICVDHAFSGRLNEIFLQETWEADDQGFRSDLRMLSLAIIHQAAVCQSVMAHPRLSEPGELDSDLPRSFSLVAQAFFEMMLETDEFWPGIKRSRPVALAGADLTPVNPPPVVELDPAARIEEFISLGRLYRALWREYLPPQLSAFLEDQLDLALAGGRPALPPDIWRDIIFEAALAFKRSPELRTDICASLGPPFLIRGLTVYLDSLTLADRQYHALLENDAVIFETGKAELARKWAEIQA